MSRNSLQDHYLKTLETFTDGKTSVKDLDYAIHVSLKHKYIFVETPKVACSTIKLTLQGLELESPEFEREDFEDLHIRDFSPLLKLQQVPDFQDYFDRSDYVTFCFVRNPYTRILSCYLDKIVLPVEITSFKKNILKGMGWDENDIEHPVSFGEFVSVIEQQEPLEMDYHWRPQVYLTCEKMIQYDFIGRLENFSEDFNKLGGQLSPDFEQYYTPEVRHKTGAASLLDTYYTDELYERVFDIYKLDFDRFSYGQ